MTLRRKTALIVGLTLFSLSIVLYVAAELIVMADYYRLEARDAERNIQRAVNAVHHYLDGMNSVLLDWAHWDDPYAYMESRDPAFVEANLYYTTFVVNKLNFMLFVDTNNQLELGKAYGFQNDKDTPPRQWMLFCNGQTGY
jgi:sensor domain CHASE-containing protein